MSKKLQVIDGEFEGEDGKSTALTIVPQPGDFSMEHWRMMKEVAADMIRSGAVPSSIDNPAKLQIIIQAGYEAGMPPVQAMGSFAIIKGRVSMWGAAVVTRINQAGHDLEWGPCDIMAAEVTITKKNGKSNTETFTIEEAREAHLLSKDVWKFYPKDMLRWKALGRCVRLWCPEVLNGVYIAEEVRDMGPKTPNAEVTEIVFEGEIETRIAESMKDMPKGKRAALRQKYQDNPEELLALLKAGTKPVPKDETFEEHMNTGPDGVQFPKKGPATASPETEVAPDLQSASQMTLKDIADGLINMGVSEADGKKLMRLYSPDPQVLLGWINRSVDWDAAEQPKGEKPELPPVPERPDMAAGAAKKKSTAPKKEASKKPSYEAVRAVAKALY